NGRHTILRGWRREAWGFKSPLPHQNYKESQRKSMIYALLTLHIIVCIFLIIVVLLQSGKSADLAGAFGGGGSQSTFGPRGAQSALSKATTTGVIIFMLTSISLSILASRGSNSSNSVLQGTKQSKPANPTAPVHAPAPA